jgi:hypothetical protein
MDFGAQALDPRFDSKVLARRAVLAQALHPLRLAPISLVAQDLHPLRLARLALLALRLNDDRRTPPDCSSGGPRGHGRRETWFRITFGRTTAT